MKIITYHPAIEKKEIKKGYYVVNQDKCENIWITIVIQINKFYGVKGY